MTHNIDLPLAGRHLVVTGGSRGIGAAVAQALAQRGAALTLIGRDESRLRAVAETLPAPAAGGRHATVIADLTVERGAAAAIESARAALGEPYGLVNNAGAAESGAFLDTATTVWRGMLDVNLMAAVFCTRGVLPAMLAKGTGRIVNVASTAGLTGYRYVSAYVAAKHALVGFTRALAMETARDGVTVNAVCPGYTDTELLAESVERASARTGRSADEIRAVYERSNPQGRLIEPGEVAGAVAWLCEPDQKSITGQTLVVDGGSIL
ncbi:MAG: SDR family oxidoreductase [Candidatus Krumholzibacteria bacterium]|nr:SDR family oxidoreductase [Candidatus Krumholzibacteria bacterium]MDH4336409.1 SDR family oxidoreductase [Candidatus Krumholzibacteria bacterium]MDH5269534.1 SDR family oxidoreductase [Candidatus Krumholzibacteria bacterium]